MKIACSRRFPALVAAALVIGAGLCPPAGAVVQSPEPVISEQEMDVEVVQQGAGPGPMRQRMGGPMPAPGDHPHAMLRMLRLTTEQQQKFQLIHFEHEKSMIKGRAEVQIKRLELEQLLSQPDFKEGEVRAKAQELQSLMAQQRQKSLDVFFQIRNLLTPEQCSRMPMRWMLHHVFGH